IQPRRSVMSPPNGQANGSMGDKFDRGTTSPVFDTRIYYNVQTVNIAGPFPNSLAMQLIADSAVSVFATRHPVDSPLVVLATEHRRSLTSCWRQSRRCLLRIPRFRCTPHC